MVVVFVGFIPVGKLIPFTLLSAGSWNVGKKEEGN